MQIGSAGAYFQTLTSTPLATGITTTNSADGAFASTLSRASAGTAVGNSRQAGSLVANLTADDRALIQQATGVAITASGFPERGGLVPKLALDIAMDRRAGRLPAGQPITAAYLNNMLAGLPMSPTSTTESQDISRMLDVLGRRGAQDGLDLRA